VRVKMPDDIPYIGGKVYWGMRELRPAYIREALNKKENEPNKAMEPTPVNVTDPANAGSAPFTSVAHLVR